MKPSVFLYVRPSNVEERHTTVRTCFTNVDFFINSDYTVKKVSDFPAPSGDVTYPTLPGREIIKLFPSRENLVSGIPAGDGKIVILFYSVLTIKACLE